MEFCVSGNALKTLNRSITCLARVGNELVIQASPSQLVFHTLNSSRSAYRAVTFKADFFDVYKLSSAHAHCSVLLKMIYALNLGVPENWHFRAYVGIRKAYWISCNVQPDIQHLSLHRGKFPSSFVVRPRDFNKLLANFQTSLQEITVIATDSTPLASDTESVIGGIAVELRSYIDPTKDNRDAALHTQPWIDPAEEFLQYSHTGDAVDVTFGVKELKAFVSFCESCEVDVHLFFERAGEPILMAPKFGLDDVSNSDFDTTLVLATMLISLLQDRNTSQLTMAHSLGAPHTSHTFAQERSRGAIPSPVSEPPSDHTRIWSELSGSAAKNFSGVEERPVQLDRCADASGKNGSQRHSRIDPSKAPLAREDEPLFDQRAVETDDLREIQDRTEGNGNRWLQHHPSNWVSADDEEEEVGEFCVQSTPQFWACLYT